VVLSFSLAREDPSAFDFCRSFAVTEVGDNNKPLRGAEGSEGVDSRRSGSVNDGVYIAEILTSSWWRESNFSSDVWVLCWH
jgi:hypothetical protein